MQFVIPARFNGPDQSGNGGVSAGLFAEFIGPSAVVTLLSPPPLDTALVVESKGDEFTAFHGTKAIMTGVLDQPDHIASPHITWAEAKSAELGYRGHEFHGAPHCFVCETLREAVDGLRIFPGPTDDPSVVAATWTPDETLGDSKGQVALPVIWGALDCPGAWAAITAEDSGKRSTIEPTVASSSFCSEMKSCKNG